jgi:anti-sigma regulatory factor (Ser/Thr protein kinase)
VRLFRRELRHALDGTSPPPDKLDDFVLAVNEAVANVFRHAYRPEQEGGCQVVVTRLPDALVAVIEDDGDTFDAVRAHGVPPMGHPMGESGRGFGIIRSLVDDFVCDVTDSGGGRMELRLALH